MDHTELRLACLKLAVEILRTEVGVPSDEVIALAQRLFDFTQNAGR